VSSSLGLDFSNELETPILLALFGSLRDITSEYPVFRGLAYTFEVNLPQKQTTKLALVPVPHLVS
jgi:hypothetical protein